MAWLGRKTWILWVGAFALGLVVALWMAREPTVPLTRDLLEAARTRWRESGIRDYRVTYSMNRDVYEVTCRDGLVHDVLVNGKAPSSASWSLYSLDGLFDVLSMDLDNLEDAQGPFAGSGAHTVILRVRFDRKLGYVARYVRSSGGMGTGASIRIESFTPMPNAAP